MLYTSRMLRETPLTTDETYHIFNRGAHQQEIFLTHQDYERFMFLLHVSNSVDQVHLRDLVKKYRGPSSVSPYDHPVGKELVDILAYALMPNHFHIVIRQKIDDGISNFMRKVATAYAMYFNLVHEHSGVVFQGRFQSRHVATEPYYRWIFSYVHLNPIDLVESGWKERGIVDKNRVEHFVGTYPYSSYLDYRGVERAERSIIALDGVPDAIRKANDLEDLLKWERRGRFLYSI